MTDSTYLHFKTELERTSDITRLYKILYKIRTQYINKNENIEKMVKFKVVDSLASLLKKRVEIQSQTEENNKIIDIILSILANCTYNNEAAANQIFNENICEQLITIINKTDNPALMAKSCRLVGNLVNEKIGLAFQQAGAALSLSNCISEKSSWNQVTTMSVRAIRLLWKSKKFRIEILSLGTISKIIICLQTALKVELKVKQGESSSSESANMVILKREKEPDRVISKEKLTSILIKMEKHNVETNYEVLKPEKKHSELEFTMPTSKECHEMISGILKLLLTITSTSSLLSQNAKSIYADGIGMHCLLFIIETSNKFRVSCLKILSNISYSPKSNEFLGVNNELIPVISNLLINSDTLELPLGLHEQKYCLEILCLSTENSCNRLKLRRSGAFKTLLSIAAKSTVQEELNLLIFAFFQYRYDKDSLNLLIQLNLINVLMKIIEDLIKDKKVDHLKNDDTTLETKDDSKIGNKRKKSSNKTVGYKKNKYMRFDSSSPSSSGYGSYQYSPSRSSSDGFSPYNSPRRCYQDYNSDSNEYSPICSDEEDSGKSKPTKDFDILEYIYKNDEIGMQLESEKKVTTEIHDEASNLTINDSDSENENESVKTELIQSSSANLENAPETLKCISTDKLNYLLLLLWKVSISHSDAYSFQNSSNLETLINVFGLVQKPNEKIYQILQNILEQTRNFVPIFIRQDFVFQIFDISAKKYSHTNCYSCDVMKSSALQLLKDFRKVAESGYGEGEIQHFLTQADVEVKRKIAVKLIFVISSLDILNKFLFLYGALEIIIDTILMDADEYLSIAACNGITVLSNNLNIKIPSEDDVLHKIIPDDFVAEDLEKYLSSDKEQVKFILKDGEILFDKETLKNASEVFNSMLSSDFRESNNNEVVFPNYTVLGVKYFFQLLQMSNETRLKCIAPKIDDMDAALQAYELSILYILTDIQKPLQNVIKIILDETNVGRVFEWSIANVDQDLLISSICFYLCGSIDGESKRKLYLKANESQYGQEWKNLIKDSILMKCRPADD